MHGKRSIVPRFQRQVILLRIDAESYSLARTSTLEDWEVDMLIFVLTGCTPSLCVYDLRVKRKASCAK